MRYMGSKNRISKYILPIILKDRKENQWYVEPFVGGANIIDKVTGNRLGSDINKYLISALELIRDNPNSLPKNNNEFKEDDYTYIKKNKDENIAFTGYCGFAFSFGGKWFGGWRRDGYNKRDYVNESYRNAIKQSPKLKGIEFKCCSYLDLEIPDRSIIYCDPPYKNTTKYKDNFDHDIFWDWCRKQYYKGHKIYISEYDAPEDFKCLWQKELPVCFSTDKKGKYNIEKLFTYERKNKC